MALLSVGLPVPLTTAGLRLEGSLTRTLTSSSLAWSSGECDSHENEFEFGVSADDSVQFKYALGRAVGVDGIIKDDFGLGESLIRTMTGSTVVSGV